MRLYIANRVNGPHCPLYDFHETVASGIWWDTQARVEAACELIAREGISVRQPFTGNDQTCTDFRIEPRLHGGYVISCEVPM
jgi:hypothetical protein